VSNSFKLCPTYCSRGAKFFLGGFSPWLRTWVTKHVFENFGVACARLHALVADLFLFIRHQEREFTKIYRQKRMIPTKCWRWMDRFLVRSTTRA